MKRTSVLLRRILVPSSKHYRNKFSVFLICVAISFFMWGLIKLSRVYDAPLKFKVTYTNLPADKVLVKAQDSILTLYVKARGLELYSKMLNPSKNKVNIDLAGMKLYSKGESYYGYVRSSRFLKELESQLSQDNTLLGVEPDTLRFVFEPEYHKRVPVKANMTLNYAPQYQLYDSILFQPDSVTIYGINSVIDTIYEIKTERKEFKGLKESRLLTLRLEKPVTHPQIRLSNDTVTSRITVERFTEATVEVVVGKGINGMANFRTFPDKVKLTCRVAMREYERMDPSLFAVSIDYKEASTTGSNLAEVKIVRQPSFAKVIRIEPSKVEFLILK